MLTFTPSHRAARTAAVLAALGFAAIAIFEAALAAGAPWGLAAWGGAHAQLSAAQRGASAAVVVVWVAAVLVVLGRAGFWRSGRFGALFRWGTWALAALSGISAVLNFASHSRWENVIFGPAALVLTILCTVVARSTQDHHQRASTRPAGQPSPVGPGR
jgi:hypothetical protein